MDNKSLLYSKFILDSSSFLQRSPNAKTKKKKHIGLSSKCGYDLDCLPNYIYLKKSILDNSISFYPNSLK